MLGIFSIKTSRNNKIITVKNLPLGENTFGRVWMYITLWMAEEIK